MRKEDAARELIESLRSIHYKSDELENLTGFALNEFLTELSDLLDLAVSILDVPPWESDKEIVWNYVWNKADYTYEEMLEKIDEARREFNPDAYEEYCKDYERAYGSRP